MRIALTGGSGVVGQAVKAEALKRGHSVVSIDRVAATDEVTSDRLRFVQAEMSDYEALLRAFEGCDVLIHLAAIPSPFHVEDHIVHNSNVVGSYNAMRAAIEQGIVRICQASSVNAIGLSYSREPHFDYLPIDESHKNHTEEPYGLSKWICEQQADTLVRRYENVRIASLRFHWVVPDRAHASRNAEISEDVAKHLWAYTRSDAAASACLLSLEAAFNGHQVFYIVAPDTTVDVPTLDLARSFFPQVPVKGDLSGFRSFFDSSKAERILGWRHPPGREGGGTAPPGQKAEMLPIP